MTKRPRPLYYRLGPGNVAVPATMEEAMRAFTNDATRRLARTELPGKCYVSTVFLAIDHAFGDGDPILFETMVFGGPLGGEQERYSTWAEAERGHARLVKAVQLAISET